MNKNIFLGHTSDVMADYKKPLLQYNKTKSLVNNGGNFQLVNNICPHQGSLIISETSTELKCQYHAWSWNSDGTPSGQGTTKICNNSRLKTQDVHIASNIMFADKIELPILDNFDFSKLELVEERTEIVKSNYQNIIDVFLDVDHIPVVHNTVYTMIGLVGDTEVEWEYYDWGNIQLVKKNFDYSDEFKETLLGIEEEKLGALWITVYPNLMIEWQPGAFFVTSLTTFNDTTSVVILKYRDKRYGDDNWKLNSDLWETAWMQDKTQAEAIVNRLNSGSNLEESKKHFREWVKNNSV
jgi:phenylpropionate dioxygenase-like ring-hydroxylating dioxygenase large terminal subunit